ncbi:metalloregulator ArsR/SmtB family transcription factor [uncultured Cohaesibacter sp.]|uniref:ArsR/SmtB family transcription factor n=1 Tax=uncultured Cohaesibacter sp. TaxID=1002546 RepID=UPI0029C671A5|nr:metalloregulator ArsR/SmtB family transcription factor [uncultured Cohaesibacter sp.]
MPSELSKIEPRPDWFAKSADRAGSAASLQPVALQCLAALSQSTRLEAFRLLASAGADGMGAGTIAKILETRHNTLSTHLSILQQSGLITSERNGRNVTYFATPGGLDALLLFLDRDCRGMMPSGEQ